MPLTKAEKQRRYREKLKACGKYDEYKKKHLLQVKKSRSKLKEAENLLTESVKKSKIEEERKKNRKRVAKFRQKKKQEFESSNSHHAFLSLQAFQKATARARRALPTTPKRRTIVCRKLLEDSKKKAQPNVELSVLSNTSITCNKISESTKELVDKFYDRHDISRQAPGRKDAVIIRNDDGSKTKVQIRHLLSSVKETHALFKKEFPSEKIGKSKFAALRPPHVYLSSKIPHNVCMCKYHENFILAVEVLHRVINFPLYSYELPETLICNPSSRSCWLNTCTTCKDAAIFKKTYPVENIENQELIKWTHWTEQNGRMLKVSEESLTTEFIAYFCDILPPFLEHCFYKREQARAYNLQHNDVLNFDETKALLQVDFSENYTCASQDEIQSAHWHQGQVSIFTYALWHSAQLHSGAIVSDNLNHSKDTIIAYLDNIFESLPATIKSVSIWSDGPRSQFKNRFICAALKRLQEEHHISIYWNYFATSHGKGPVDGIGGAVKRHVWQQVLSRKAVVINASTFTKAAHGMQNVTVTELTSDDIQRRNKRLNLESIFVEATVVSGIAAMHHIKFDQQLGLCTFTITKDDNFQVSSSSASTSSSATSSSNNIEIGDWYVVNYDGLFFPGEVIAYGDQGDYQVSVMEPAGANWKWPQPLDVIFYRRENIVKKIDKPEVANSRGHFKFPVCF
ncbi:hypothetical protein SNE40_020732 [Patella caerulea]|uniref:Uncharacterized protein n=1 Tax=Patella caerulea TaxID=87958 RepID=A0AAN8J4W0_PATCE